jgi:ABC-type glycerol-3-phosphate transport system substrate-binding protein
MNIGSLSKFQLFFLGLLVVAIVLAVGIFALNKSSNGGVVSNVVIWGTLPDTTMKTFLQRPEMIATFTAKKVAVTYVSKPANTFDQDVVEAIASGKGPDAVMISQDAALQYLDKIIMIPYSSFSESSFKDSQKGYVQEAELFLTKQGIEALPFTLDPIVMYWNRTMLTNAGIASPPTLWSQFYIPDGVIAKINKIDTNHNIIKTALALGTYSNVSHAKDILSLLMFQAGSKIVGMNTTGSLQSVLSSSNSSAVASGAEAALSFYTQFADPAKSIYSWNTALPVSRDAFVAGDLALYFGYASELNNIYARNPNLNFDVALIPQSQSSLANVTFGKVYGLSILKSTSNATATYDAIVALTTSASQAVWSNVSGFPPVTRDLLAIKPTSAFMSVFYTATLQSRGWLDPNRSLTDAIFGEMVGSVLSGSKQSSDAVRDGNERLGQLLNAFSN